MLTTTRGKAGTRRIPVALPAICILVALVLATPVPLRPPAGKAATALSAIIVSAADTNSNGLLDAVLVNFTTNLTAGLFEVSAELDVPLPGPIASYGSMRNGTTLNLSAGPHPFSLTVPAQLIPEASRDGPYNLTVAVVQLLPGRLPSELYAVSVHTPPWNRGDFDLAPVRFDGQLLEEPRDIHGDGHYDEVVLYVPVSVARATRVNLTGSFVSPPESVEARAGGRVLEKGFYVLNLTFDGLMIYETQTDGPYWVALDLSDGAGLAHRMFYQTEPYVYTQFARPGADFRGAPTVVPHYSAADGRIDRLQVQVPLRVRLAGDYAAAVSATDCSSCGPTFPVGARRLLHLDPGNVTVDLNVSATLLSRYVGAAPVSLSVVVSGLLGTGGSNNTTVDSGVSNRSLLENPYEEPFGLNVTLLQPGCGVPRVLVLDPSDGFFADAAAQPTNSVARFAFPLYNGTFEVLVQGYDCAGSSSSLVTNVTVEGPAYVDLNAPPVLPQEDDAVASFASWSAFTTDVRVNWTGRSPTLRFLADAFGNQDGNANPEELRLAVEDFAYPWNYVSDIAVDGTAATANASVLSVVQGAARVISDAAVVTDLQTTGSTDPAAAAGPTHTIVVDVPCCNVTAHQSLTVQLPPDVDGTVSVARYSPTDFNPLVALANATASENAPGTWSVRLGATPPSGAPTDEFRITIISTQGTGTPAAAVPVALAVAGVAAVAVAVAVILSRRRKRPKPDVDTPPPHP